MKKFKVVELGVEKQVIDSYKSTLNAHQTGRLVGCSRMAITRFLKLKGVYVEGHRHKGSDNSMFGKTHSNKAKEKIKLKVVERVNNGWKSPLKNKTRSEKDIKSITEGIIKAMARPEVKKKMCVPKTKEHRKKLSIIKKKQFQDPVWVKNWVSKMSVKPTKPEQQLIDLIKENNFPFEFVGDFKFWINGKNPDFKHKTDKKLIELFSVFHDPKVFDVKWHRTEKGTRKIYERNGYKVLILWQDELKDLEAVEDRIEQFASSNELTLAKSLGEAL